MSAVVRPRRTERKGKSSGPRWPTRAWHFVRRWGIRAVVGVVVWTLSLNLVIPPVTATMIGRSLEASWAAGSPRWVAHDTVAMPDFGPWIPRAAVQSEDAWFFHHHGFDFHAVEKALADAEDGLPSRGASTISQQVAKNVFLWQGDGLVSRGVRKALELPLTVLLELLVPKTRILEIYLNIAETGPMVFGFEAGAQHHFSKPADKLSATEAARLVAVLPNPRVWKPTGGYAGKRAARILRNSVPFPGESGFDEMADRAGEHAWPWGLVDAAR